MLVSQKGIDKCAVPENIHRVNGNSKGEGVGIAKAKVFKENYGAYIVILLEFQMDGGGGANQTTLCGGMDIFRNHTISWKFTVNVL